VMRVGVMAPEALSAGVEEIGSGFPGPVLPSSGVVDGGVAGVAVVPTKFSLSNRK